jgi:hypothetical protein
MSGRHHFYIPGPGAAPELPEDELTHAHHVIIRRYQAERHHERRWKKLTPRRRAEIGPLLDELEERAREQGIPSRLMNTWRAYPGDGMLAELDVHTHGITETLPRGKRKQNPPAPGKPVAEQADELEQQLAASLEQLRAR